MTPQNFFLGHNEGTSLQILLRSLKVITLLIFFSLFTTEIELTSVHKEYHFLYRINALKIWNKNVKIFFLILKTTRYLLFSYLLLNRIFEFFNQLKDISKNNGT